MKNNNLQKKINNKISVAFLGGSLPMLIFAYLYKRKNNHHVSILEESNNIGGAWGQFNDKNSYFSKQSNIILPLSKKQEKNQNKMNFFLKKYLNVRVKNIDKIVNVHYSFKNKFYYNFNFFYKKIYKLNLIKKIKVNKIQILKNKKILINKKYEYDKVFIPTYFGINKIHNLNRVIRFDFKTINSKHIIALFKKTKFTNLFYSDFFNDFFDRVQFIKYPKFYFFSARITKKNKNSKLNLIKKEIKKITNDEKIIKFYKFTYKNYYRDEKQIKKIENLKKIENFEYVNTTNFMQFMQQLFDYFKYKSIKSRLLLSK